MASFSRIMKLAALLLPLAAAIPTVDKTETDVTHAFSLPDGKTVAEAMNKEDTPDFSLPDGMTVADAMKKHVPRSSGCADQNGGVHIIVARGSTEPPGEGALGAVSSMIQQGIPGSDSMGIDYPALLSPYQWSVGQGTDALNQAIESYVAQCPKSRIVLMGYSQGGQVVMNSLCGTNELSFTPTKRIAKKYWHHIAAVLVYADPSHLAGKTYDKGTATLNGMFPRERSHLCKPFAKRIASYCDYNDPVCASGWNGTVHTTYFANYDSQAAPWIINKAQHHLPWTRNQNH